MDLLLISETEIRILQGEGVTVALIVGIAVLTVVADILDMIVCEGEGEIHCESLCHPCSGVACVVSFLTSKI